MKLKKTFKDLVISLEEKWERNPGGQNKISKYNCKYRFVKIPVKFLGVITFI